MKFTPSIAAYLSYLIMLAAYFFPRQRLFHIPAMLAIMVFDLALPVYLYLNHDWWHRLIEKQEIFSSLVWMHFVFFMAMYALDVMQINSGRRIMKGDDSAREDHRAQAKALLLVRGLVVVSGAILANP